MPRLVDRFFIGHILRQAEQLPHFGIGPHPGLFPVKQENMPDADVGVGDNVVVFRQRFIGFLHQRPLLFFQRVGFALNLQDQNNGGQQGRPQNQAGSDQAPVCDFRALGRGDIVAVKAGGGYIIDGSLDFCPVLPLPLIHKRAEQLLEAGVIGANNGRI